MRAQRSVIAIVALLSLGAIAPVASATPVLSGYGGPGQGSQALLGSALLNGGGGGGGRGGGGGGTHLARDPSSPEPVTAPATAAAQAAAGSATPAATTGGKRNRAGKQPAGSARNPALPPVTISEKGTAGSAGVLTGFSRDDLLYTLLALLALAMSAFATRWLANRPSQAGAGAKEISRHARSPE